MATFALCARSMSPRCSPRSFAATAGQLARVSCGVVRAADDAGAARDLPTAHWPQHATIAAVARGLAGVRPTRPAKSFVLATIAVFLACFRDWRPHLGPGERGTVMVIAADRRQARDDHALLSSACCAACRCWRN